MISKFKVKHFNLDDTLCCGQAFRWKKHSNGYWYGVVNSQIIKIKQEGNFLLYRTYPFKQNTFLLNNYFNLKLSYPRLINSLPKDKYILRAIKKYNGLRLLRQEPLECLISYLISINKNIPAISTIIENLCKKYGEKIKFEGMSFYSFPEINVLSKLSLNDLKKLKVGFRAVFIQDAIKKISSKEIDLEKLEKLDHETAKQELLKIHGVGEKVADCVLLFAYNKYEAFPVDVWIKRCVGHFYFRGKKVTDKMIREFAKKKFGKYAGYAQQFLYHYTRENRSTCLIAV